MCRICFIIKIKIVYQVEKVIIGSRGSDLALWQANHVTKQLEDLGHEVELQIIKTRGDQIQHLSFDKMEGKGFFTKEIEEKLLDNTVDLAVHSHKDLETQSPDGLAIAAVSEREDPADLLLIRPEVFDENGKWGLKENAIVGTSSARRKSQILLHCPTVEIKDLRGNVPTRINKLRDGGYDAIMLANAGVSRLELDLSDLKVVVLDPKEFVPAPAQGVLGLQIRENDTRMAAIMKNLHTPAVKVCIYIEREVLRRLQGGCQLPLGVYAIQEEGVFKVWTSMAKSWDATPVRIYKEGTDGEVIINEILEEIKKNK